MKMSQKSIHAIQHNVEKQKISYCHIDIQISGVLPSLQSISSIYLFLTDQIIWDGPRSLHDMLEKDEPFSDIARYVADYKLNLIAPSEIESFDQFHTSVREVLEILKYAGDETGMDHLIHSNPSYQKLENEAVYVINQFVNLGLSVDETEGETDMCKAWDDHKKAGIREGEERGRKGILISLCRSGEISVEVAAREMNISTEKFKEYLV